MSYVDSKYYHETFKGEPVSENDFPSLLSRASEIVEEMCMYRVTPIIFEAMPKNVQEKIKCAVCAQIEYLDANGGTDMDNGVDIQSASLGKYSYTAAAGQRDSSTGQSGSTGQSAYSPRAQRILFPTGLLYRGGGCYASHP